MSDRLLAAEVVLPCAALDETVDFFVGELGFRLDAIIPADDPQAALVSGHGVRLRLERGYRGGAGELRLVCAGTEARPPITAPNGTVVSFRAAEPAVVMPPIEPAFVLTRASAATWSDGRAGMQYRDLIAGRQGGRVIASHIRIPGGGPVPDYVHFHDVRFQLIYCVAGWVRVVYQDQGSPFVLEPGDCVLQPPGIRHRVLESSPGLEVVEVGSPAAHTTHVDHELALPSREPRPEQVYGGQRFVRHVAAAATWSASAPGFERRSLGLAEATGGLIAGYVVRASGAAASSAVGVHHDELRFGFVAAGSIELTGPDGAVVTLARGDAVAIPAGVEHAFGRADADFEMLDVRVSATR